MTIDDEIKDEKLQYNINREAAKLSALSSSKTDKYEYLTGEDILSSSNQKITEQARSTYSPLEKALEKQTKIIEDQRKKQVKALKVLEPKSTGSKSSKQSINKDVYNKILEERVDEILEMSKKLIMVI